MLVRANDHRHRVPANVGADPLLKLHVAWAWHFEMGRDGIDVGRVGGEWNVRTRSTGLLNQLLKKCVRTLGPLALNDPLQRIQPFLGFLRVWIMDRTSELFRYCIHSCLLPTQRRAMIQSFRVLQRTCKTYFQIGKPFFIMRNYNNYEYV